jgi:DNA-binding transcriptional LysR family regulator
VGLDQLLPGLNDALRSMRGAVQEALAETDDILFALSLGAAFEAGRRLIDTVGRILAEIDEIVADAVGGQVRNIIGIFETFFDGLDETLKALAREVLMEVLVLALDQSTAEILAKAIVEGDGDTAQIAEKSAEWLADLIVAEGADEAPFVAFPVPPLDGLHFGGGTMVSGRPMAEVVLECLVPTNKQIRDLAITRFFKDLMLGVKPEDALETGKGSLKIVQAEQMQKVQDGLAAAPGPFCEDEITALPAQTALADIQLRIETYRCFLVGAEGAAKELMEDTTDRAVDVLYLIFKREIDLVLTAQTHLQTAGRAVRSGNLLRAAQSAMAFVELFAGASSS